MLFKISLVICTINLRRFVLTRKVQALKKTISIFLDSTVWLHRWNNFVSRNVRHEIILVMDRFKELGLADHVTSNRMFSSITLLTDRLVSDDLIVRYRDEVLDRYCVGWDVSVKILHGLYPILFWSADPLLTMSACLTIWLDLNLWMEFLLVDIDQVHGRRPENYLCQNTCNLVMFTVEKFSTRIFVN
jgi:hypothetical protein